MDKFAIIFLFEKPEHLSKETKKKKNSMKNKF